jgi:hypothetical protein
MLSGVLRSDRAITVNIEIMRAFVELRRAAGSFKELQQRLDQIELDIGARLSEHDEQLRQIFEALRQLIAPPPKAKSPVGLNRPGFLNVPTGGDRDLGHPLEVVDVRSDHDVYILCAAHDAPGIYRQPSDDYEFDVSFGEAPQQLVEGRLAQLPRAAPVNRISLWLRAIPSARFTLSGRRASSRSRRTRTVSAF